MTHGHNLVFEFLGDAIFTIVHVLDEESLTCVWVIRILEGSPVEVCADLTFNFVLL